MTGADTLVGKVMKDPDQYNCKCIVGTSGMKGVDTDRSVKKDTQCC